MHFHLNEANNDVIVMYKNSAKEVVWLRKFLNYLEVVSNMSLSITLYCVV